MLKEYLVKGLALNDDFLKLSGKELLTHAGTISAELAKEKSNLEYDKFKERTQDALTPAEQHFLQSLEQTEKKLLAKQKKSPENR